MGSEKIILVTNASQLSDVNASATFGGFENLKNNGFMIFADGKLLATDDLKDADIVFVWDRNIRGTTDKPEWWADTFLPLKNDDKWYVVHHSKGLNSKQITPSAAVVCRQGEHMSSNFVYRETVKILLDNEENKKDRIIQSVLFPLEAVLEFLHACLEKKPEAADLEEFERETGIAISPKELKGELYSDEYFKSLEKWRDRLLNVSGGKSDNCG